MESLCIVFPQPGKIEVWKEPVPALEPGEVLCAAEKSLISIGTELYCLQGICDPGTNWAAFLKYPYHPGYSMAARVIEVGRDVSGAKEGDRVLAWVAHRQFFKAPADQLHPIPEDLSYEEGTWGIVATPTQLAVRRAELALGETVGVIGLGMLGQLITQYLVVAGARRVAVIDTVEGRLKTAKAHGATHALQMDVKGARQAVQEITGGRMLDAVFDVTGHPAVLASAIQLLRKLGRLILVGDTPTPLQQTLGPGVVSNSIGILGIHGSMSSPYFSEFSPWTRHEIVALFYDYLLQGRMRISDLITHRYSPMDAPQVYAGLVRDRSSAIGVIFDWSLL